MGLLYVGVSVACLVAKHVAIIESSIRDHWNWVWLLGPPVTLIYGLNYWVVYVVGTGFLITLELIVRSSWQRRPGVVLLCLLLAIVAWCGSGLLVYAPVM
jgi:hypothetical protein